MRIERIDDNTVKCFLSNEELEEFEITYKDFVTRSDKAREVVEVIIGQAEEEVGYQPPKFAFDLQIMLLPDKGMILTFSEKDPLDKKTEDSMLSCMQELSKLMKGKREGEAKAENIAPVQNEASEENKDYEENKVPEFAVFTFKSLNTVCRYASIVPARLWVNSSLYQMGDNYYLYIEKGKAAKERYRKACIHALEFGALHTADRKKLSYLREHGRCIIEEKAIKKLCKI